MHTEASKSNKSQELISETVCLTFMIFDMWVGLGMIPPGEGVPLIWGTTTGGRGTTYRMPYIHDI